MRDEKIRKGRCIGQREKGCMADAKNEKISDYVNKDLQKQAKNMNRPLLRMIFVGSFFEWCAQEKCFLHGRGWHGGLGGGHTAFVGGDEKKKGTVGF